LMGLLWSADTGYTVGLWWMLSASVVGVVALHLQIRRQQSV
jgi:hypothetical protein